MDTTVLKKMREFTRRLDMPESSRRYYHRQWLKSVRLLGDKWLLSRNFKRIT